MTSDIDTNPTPPEIAPRDDGGQPSTLMLCAYALVEEPNGGEPQLFVRPIREATPEEAVAAWIDTEVPGQQLGVPFMKALVNKHLMSGHLRSIYHILRDLEPHQREITIRLIVAGAFSRRELIHPGRITGYLTRPDWPQILAEWENQDTTREIRHIAKRYRERRTTCPTSSATTCCPSQPLMAPAAPMTLVEVLQTHLPAKAQPMADAVAVALKLMKAELRPWSMEAIVTRIRNVMGATARVADRLVEEAFRWLAQHGVLERANGYRLCDNAKSGVGQQILGMIG